jgi:hypothetical protein
MKIRNPEFVSARPFLTGVKTILESFGTSVHTLHMGDDAVQLKMTEEVPKTAPYLLKPAVVFAGLLLIFR